MGIIRTIPFIRHYQGSPTEHVIRLRRGRVVRSGVGRAFWFLPATTALSELRVVDRERAVLFHVVTADQQDVTVQATLTYRIADPGLAASRFDFDIYPRSVDGPPRGEEEIGELVAGIAQSLTVDVVGGLTMAEALHGGLERVGEALAAGLPGQERLSGSGVEVCDVRVLSLRPEGDIEKALQTPLREQLQAEADRALYERRALAVEREQQISVNELASRLDLARRREELVAQEGANARREAEEKAAAALVDTSAAAERRRIRSEAEAAETERVGRAANEVEAARLSALAGIGAEVLRAMALQEAAKHLPQVGQINLAPDILQGLLAGLLPGSGAGEGRA